MWVYTLTEYDLYFGVTYYWWVHTYMDYILACLLYTSDAADDTPCVDLGGRRII